MSTKHPRRPITPDTGSSIPADLTPVEAPAGPPPPPEVAAEIVAKASAPLMAWTHKTRETIGNLKSAASPTLEGEERAALLARVVVGSTGKPIIVEGLGVVEVRARGWSIADASGAVWIVEDPAAAPKV